MDVLQFDAVYVDVGEHLKKIILEKKKNFTFCETIIISVFQWLNKNNCENILTASYEH